MNAAYFILTVNKCKYEGTVGAQFQNNYNKFMLGMHHEYEYFHRYIQYINAHRNILLKRHGNVHMYTFLCVIRLLFAGTVHCSYRLQRVKLIKAQDGEV